MHGQALDLLNGTWLLAYTSNSELSQLLALSRLPFLTVGPIQQIVDTGFMTAQNKVRHSIMVWSYKWSLGSGVRPCEARYRMVQQIRVVRALAGPYAGMHGA